MREIKVESIKGINVGKGKSEDFEKLVSSCFRLKPERIYIPKGKSWLQRYIAKFLFRFGFVQLTEVKAKLNFARNVAKRLDEHRELVELLEREGVLASKFWVVGWLATQDDYLMRLYFMVHGHFPITKKSVTDYQTHNLYKLASLEGFVRDRPEILKECDLPEFNKH
ncbi:hypothetical protein O3K13_06620 [Yersinia pestis]|nr:hypothetical protein [Yersinia pestis]